MSLPDCWCDQYDEARNMSVRCMHRALDLGCCGEGEPGGKCCCSPLTTLRARVAASAAENPEMFRP